MEGEYDFLGRDGDVTRQLDESLSPVVVFVQFLSEALERSMYVRWSCTVDRRG